jgi:hypothetical protein
MFCEYKRRDDFIGMDMSRKFLEMGHTRARRYANHSSGRKYAKDGSVSPYEKDCLTKKINNERDRRNVLKLEDLLYQEERRKRKVKKLNFEIR